ncbi:uncharacterized protein LOC143905780 [Temnothorax americanus]|uniref:uncharacterized protein LOC143905780 n=1 Tax=Temnothorax americanus TaxID=1964332 RepID=UPI004068C575
MEGSDNSDSSSESSHGSLLSSLADAHFVLDLIQLQRRIEEYWKKRRDAELHAVIVRAGGGAAASVAAKRFQYYWKRKTSLPWNWRQQFPRYRSAGDFKTYIDTDHWQPANKNCMPEHWRRPPEFYTPAAIARAAKKSWHEPRKWLEIRRTVYDGPVKMSDEELTRNLEVELGMELLSELEQMLAEEPEPEPELEQSNSPREPFLEISSTSSELEEEEEQE